MAAKLELGPAPELDLLDGAVHLSLDVDTPVDEQDGPLVEQEGGVDLLRIS